MIFTPVQMIGTQRSGSNLLRLMLNQLDGVSAPHPPHILERFYPLLPAYDDLSVPDNFARLVSDICKLIEFNPVPWSGVNLDPKAIITRCKKPLLTEIFRVIYEMRAESENATIWICKSLVNIRFADQLEKNGVCPLYIHLFRDGRDVALSFKKAIVGEKHMYFVAKQWKEEQEASLKLAAEIGDKRVLRVRYEDLLAHPVKELKKICGFIGAEYNPAAMDYYHSEESHKTAHSGVMWENVEKPVIRNNYNKFRKELSPADIHIFEQVAGDTLEKLGYSRVFPGEAEHQFSADEIAPFAELNKKLKQEARLQSRPEDIQKRKNLEVHLQQIEERIHIRR